tara:strand:+ start:1260 stop:1892 length:633 start_codon:yes stop_codon:yes gene_type:complete
MILGKYHATIDEVTYDQKELFDFYKSHEQHVETFSDVMKYLTPSKREFRGRPGMNAVNVHKTEGKYLGEYPIIKKIVSQFNFEKEITDKEVDLLHYDPGYKFHPHTDHFMKCGIMFPIIPESNFTPISFYSRKGHDPERNVNYEKRYGWTDDDIEYNHYYSMKHPTLFNGMAVHGVPTINEERVMLRIKVLGESFEDIVDKLKQGIFIKE